MTEIRNVKAISDDDIREFEEAYDVTIKGNDIVVNSLKRNTSTLHPLGKPFNITSRYIRKVTFTVDAINLWKDHFMLTHSLFRVQAAVNKLIITYSPVNYETVNKCLEEK